MGQWVLLKQCEYGLRENRLISFTTSLIQRRKPYNSLDWCQKAKKKICYFLGYRNLQGDIAFLIKMVFKKAR